VIRMYRGLVDEAPSSARRVRLPGRVGPLSSPWPALRAEHASPGGARADPAPGGQVPEGPLPEDAQGAEERAALVREPTRPWWGGGRSRKRGSANPYVKNFVLARTTPSPAAHDAPRFEQTFRKSSTTSRPSTSPKVRHEVHPRSAIMADRRLSDGPPSSSPAEINVAPVRAARLVDRGRQAPPRAHLRGLRRPSRHDRGGRRPRPSSTIRSGSRLQPRVIDLNTHDAAASPPRLRLARRVEDVRRPARRQRPAPRRRTAARAAARTLSSAAPPSVLPGRAHGARRLEAGSPERCARASARWPSDRARRRPGRPPILDPPGQVEVEGGDAARVVGVRSITTRL